MNDIQQAPKALLRAQKLANLADAKIRIPILGIRLGLDFIIGLNSCSGRYYNGWLIAQYCWYGEIYARAKNP